MANSMAWVKGLAVLCITLTSVAWAQATPPKSESYPAAGISLLSAITLALQKNPDIQISQTNVAINQGALQSAGGPFDPLLNASTNIAETPSRVRDTNTSLGVSQQLRSGIVLGASLSGQSRNTFDTPPAGSAATLGVSIAFPLLRGRGETFAAAGENAARLVLQKSQYDVRHAVSATVYFTAIAYWNLRAAEEVLDAQRESELRAQRLVNDIQRLIDAGERPAADINLIKANLTGKRTARLAAEQGLINARLALAEKIGLDYVQFNEITNTSDTFPVHNSETVLIKNAATLVAKATEHRFDLKSANTHLEALRIAVNSAKDNLKPILTLTVGANYIGNTTGENPLQVLARRTGESQLSANLSYTWDVVNSKSKGNFLSQSASYDQQAVAIRALQMSIGVGVENAVAGYNRSMQQLKESQFTVELYTKIVENEKIKLKIGSATLLDLVNVESQRQDALLNHISQRAAYASAIAALRFQMGELISDGAETQVLSVQPLRAYGLNDSALNH